MYSVMVQALARLGQWLYGSGKGYDIYRDAGQDTEWKLASLAFKV